MERRDFLKIAFGVAAGAAAFAATAQAAPLAPLLLNQDARAPAGSDAHPAVTTGDEVDHLKPEQVHWHHGHGRWHHRHWHHRHWGWRHRHRHWRRHHHWRRW
ncbi:twin-arginine translocation signal domain-containing protein [Bradyrhizobium viridifuturi]|uniref:twin-arginine translocation signal domain-containing protein n=1 Tax=Bradyrhizobium viridifuturi TaxID=1654716 RepID=UPI00067F3BF4|nr:twin-arginine translocation signal domain-containing protein [Bradyrhizobium viridifuturi]